MNNWELPLVLFTVLGQAAVGTALLSGILEPQLAPEHAKTRYGLRMAGVLVFPLLLVALILSVFHLGQPLAAYRALRHFGTAWLSREIWFFGITTVLAAVYSHLCYHDRNPEIRSNLGLLTGVAGLVAVWSSAMVYALPARPFWSPLLNTLTFFGTAVLLGALVVAVCTRWAGANSETTPVARVTGWATVIGAVLVVVALAATTARGASDVKVMQAVALMGSSWLFWVRLALGLAMPVGVAVSLVRGRDVTTRQVALGLAFALVGELAGRIVFYTSALGPSLWG
ncbi:MAG TPA: DmsC/YnfH family molybdoenzyme membrane anchor subunit [Symbiobacteriaceae bacterium]|nr:DmsC/YnfH family molybdoenzyme membrane anchor subunit [Symbiobacteriaceae bacterium]